MGAPCGDLRFDADAGVGHTEGWVSSYYPGSGSYKLSTCYVGIVWDPLREVRTQYYVEARQALALSAPSKCNDGLLSPTEADVDWCVRVALDSSCDIGTALTCLG